MVLSWVGMGETDGSGRSVGSPVLLQALIIELITRAVGMIIFSQFFVTEGAPENSHRLIVYYREQDRFVVNDIVF
jgi:flagellar basal body-associated protein FliL